MKDDRRDGSAQPEPLPAGLSTFERPVEAAAAALAQKGTTTAEDRLRYVEIVSRHAEEVAGRLLARYGVGSAKP